MKYLIFLLLFTSLYAGPWAEKTLREMNLDEKIGQLFIIPAVPSFDQKHKDDVVKLIAKYHIGGIIIKGGTCAQTKELIFELQKISSIPLLITSDAEWGLGMRISDGFSYPKNLTLGAINDNHLIYLMGKEVGKGCQNLGIHLNFAPVVDVNTNPLNPIIGMRSFGEDPKKVSEKAEAFICGMQEEGLLCTAKHFPGHGDTIADSHLDLPVINHSMDCLLNCELVPFNTDADCVMTAHLLVPAIDDLPITFSYKAVTSLLQERLGFKGLIITDALNMKGITNSWPKHEIALMALLAGHDLLLYGDHIAPNIEEILHVDIPLSFESIKEGILCKKISEDCLDRHVLKILEIKEKILPHHDEKFGSPIVLKKELYRNAITLISDEKKLLPLKEDVDLVAFGGKELISQYLPKKNGSNCIVVAVMNKATQEELIEIHALIKNYEKKILVLCASPYFLPQFKGFDAVIAAYENDELCQEAGAELLMGTFPFKGTLPITLF